MRRSLVNGAVSAHANKCASARVCHDFRSRPENEIRKTASACVHFILADPIARGYRNPDLRVALQGPLAQHRATREAGESDEVLWRIQSAESAVGGCGPQRRIKKGPTFECRSRVVKLQFPGLCIHRFFLPSL